MRSLTPQAKPAESDHSERKCSITVTFASSSATRSRCGKIDSIFAVATNGKSRSVVRSQRRAAQREMSLMRRAPDAGQRTWPNQARPVRHEIFPEEICVLDHGALERLKDYTAPFQIFGNDVPLDQLIARKNQARRVFVEPARILQNIFAIVFRKQIADFEWRQIEKINIGKSPALIFSRRVRQRFELFPRCALLITKPIWKIARLGRAGENRRPL